MSEPYRPSNGTEGICFIGQFCDNCTKENPDNDLFCDIQTLTAAYSVDDPKYPKEWVYDAEGNPTCTAFDRREE